MRTILLACCALACHAAPIHVGGSIGPSTVHLYDGLGWFSFTGSLISATEIHDNFYPQYPPPASFLGTILINAYGTLCYPSCYDTFATVSWGQASLDDGLYITDKVTHFTQHISLTADQVYRPTWADPLVLGVPVPVPEPGTWLTVLLPLVGLRLAGLLRAWAQRR